MDGCDLTDVITDHPGGMPLERVLHITRQVCSALSDIHEKGIVHRDLKPDNILIGTRDVVKITDFGISRALENPKITRTGMIIGTLEFMSPEQVMAQAVDSRSDIYSLGLIIYAMLAGRTPFESDTPHGYLQKHAYETPSSPRQFRKDLDKGVEKVVMKTLEKKPEKRYQDVETLSAELKQAIGGRAEKKKSAPIPKTRVVNDLSAEQPNYRQRFTLTNSIILAVPTLMFSLMPGFSPVGPVLLLTAPFFMWWSYPKIAGRTTWMKRAGFYLLGLMLLTVFMTIVTYIVLSGVDWGFEDHEFEAVIIGTPFMIFFLGLVVTIIIFVVNILFRKHLFDDEDPR